MREFPNLSAPMTIKGVTFRNRIIAAPIGFVWPDPYSSMPDPHTIFNHEDRARGGAAIVTLGETAVSRNRAMRRSDGDVLVPDDDRLIYPAQAWLKLTDAILRHGAVPNIQLFHAGSNTAPMWIGGKDPIGPDAFVNEFGAQVVAMDEELMNEVADEFAEAAWWAKYANFPMVQLHGAHGWLLAQFLSPLTNHRKDKYGGSLENRARFPLMVCERIRKRVGDDFIIEYRMSGDEHLDGGGTADEAVEFGRMLEQYVDILHISSGSYYASRQYTFPTIFTPHGCNLHLAEAFKKGGVKIPVVSVGAYSDPEQMDRAIAEGKADFIAVCRQIAADPMFPRKVLTGHKEDVTPCTRCINCLGNKYKSRNECDVNPVMGNEVYTMRTPAPKERRKVLIAGGGPGGMKAAITAAERGHEVILCEKSGVLGGRLTFTDVDCHKSDLRRYKDFLIREVDKSAVEVRLNTEVTPELIAYEKPYAVIAAVGGHFLTPPIPGITGKNVMHASDVYFRPGEVGKRVVMIGGGLMGVEVGLHLADGCGKDVTIVEMCDELARDANPIHKAALDEMLEKFITSRVKTTVLEITDAGVKVRNADGTEEVIPADTVLYAVGMKPDREGVEKLRACDDHQMFMPVGDCVPGSPITAKGIKDAIHGGYFAAMDII